jgi:hypothetical protein
MLHAVSALLLLLSASYALALPSTTAPVLRRVDSTRNNGIHLAIGPTCGSKGGNATNINEGLRTLGTYKTIVSFGVRRARSLLLESVCGLTRSRGMVGLVHDGRKRGRRPATPAGPHRHEPQGGRPHDERRGVDRGRRERHRRDLHGLRGARRMFTLRSWSS